MDPFSQEQKDALIKELDAERVRAAHWSDYNHGYEIWFRIIVALMSIAIAVCSGIAAVDSKVPSVKLSATSGILAGVIAIVSGFAFQTFDFSGRRERWAVKAAAIRALIDQLRFLEPDRVRFLARKDVVLAYDPDRGESLSAEV